MKKPSPYKEEMAGPEVELIDEPDHRHEWHGKDIPANLKTEYRLRNGKKIRLTPKQRLFVSEYLKDLNATEAAIRAGYSPGGIRGGGYNRPEQNAHVQEAISAEMDFRAAAANVTADRVLAEYAKIAFGDARRLMGWNAEGEIKLKPSDDIDPDDTAAVSEITVSAKGGLRIRMHDKVKALDSLAKHMGMFREHNKREVTVSLEQLVLQSYTALPAPDGVALPAPAVEPMQLAEKWVKHEFDARYGSGVPVLDAVLADGDGDGGDDE